MGTPSPVRLILASGSPARRELLTQAGYAFEVIPSSIDEPTEAGVHGIRHYVQQVSWLHKLSNNVNRHIHINVE